MNVGTNALFNRLGNDLIIDWNGVDFIEVNTEQQILTFMFKSGNKKSISNQEQIAKILDLASMFPDILNDDVREEMKQMNAIMKQRMAQEVYSQRQGSIRNPIQKQGHMRSNVRSDFPQQ